MFHSQKVTRWFLLCMMWLSSSVASVFFLCDFERDVHHCTVETCAMCDFEPSEDDDEDLTESGYILPCISFMLHSEVFGEMFPKSVTSMKKVSEGYLRGLLRLVAPDRMSCVCGFKLQNILNGGVCGFSTYTIFVIKNGEIYK